MKKETTLIAMRIETPILKKIKAIAEKQDMTVSAVIRVAIKKHLSK